MGNNVDEIDEQDDEERLERVAAIDVAKATGKVCVRLAHRSVPGRRVEQGLRGQRDDQRHHGPG